ncbi:archaea-specific SMC-related protein [Halogeometricum luteum]|uniref:ATPase n=1 Tax=Halogeometricum luteum TaxID=2950537 RepID=A0ABU2FZ80_9EURY|nr:archaea-specific SMC-related protein [Halogeometricum sp. S3BR5-2]MDS0293825.1 ATPase [Halogeometricum sp. S3BR5-2]
MSWRLAVENVAGIRRGEATLEPGLNAVRASNWQGKSSFLSAIGTVLGAESTLTEGESEGCVSLRTDEGEEYEVRLRRRGETVVAEGSPYLTDDADRVCLDLFALLDEGNEVRRAVREGADLGPILTRPLDFEDIDERIDEHRRERDAVDDDLSAVDAAADRVPVLRTRADELESDLADLREAREGVAADGDEGLREDLSTAEAERGRVRDRRERLSDTVDRVEERLAERREELASLPAVDEGDDETPEEELSAVRERHRRRERDAELLRSVYEANRRVVEEDRLDLLTDVTRGVEADSLDCWVCGRETTAESVDERLAALADRIRSLESESESLAERADELEAAREERARVRRRRSELRAEVRDLEERLADAERRLAETDSEAERLDERIERLRSSLSASTERATDVESDLKYTEARLEDAREELAEAEAAADRREELREQRERLTAELADLRRRKAAVRRRTREAFDRTIEEVAGLFETSFETARLTSDFELVVARDGREVPTSALSEGEVELLGIAAAVAGHRAYDVGERVPVVTLDRLGGIADDNLGRLTEYLLDRSEYLVTTAYPEHSSVTGHEVDPAEWRVVSDRPETSH